LATEILGRIENGDSVIYEHVAIVGDLDLSTIDLPIMGIDRPDSSGQVARVVAARIQIKDCQIRGSINFAGAVFEESVDFGGSAFAGDARFKGSAFRGWAAFDASHFDKYATFKDASFSEEASWIGASFGAIANFGNALFSSSASFGSARFSDLCTNFSGVRFDGDADFTGAHFAGTANFKQAAFGKTASFWQANFEADSVFEKANFMGYASFLKSSFGGNADFRHSEFGEEITFERSMFGGHCIFLGSRFEGKSNFSSSQFAGVANFDDVLLKDAIFVDAEFHQASYTRAKFEGDAHFERTRFTDAAQFFRSEFSSVANFKLADFNCPTSFEYGHFFGATHFSGARFREEASFEGAEFAGDTSFNSTYFDGKALLKGAKFGQDARFLGVRFVEAADFTGCEFRKNLTLENARIYTLRLLETIFDTESRISLHGSDFIRLEVRWSSIKEKLVYDGAVYLALIKNFRNMEWFEDADDCYFQYRRKSQAEKKFYGLDGDVPSVNWSKLLDGMAWISCGYGVRPKYTVFLSIFLILLFAGLFWTGDSIVVEHISTTAKGAHLAEDDLVKSLSFADYLYFSAMTFMAKTQVKWYPAGIYRYLATIESILGWLLMALFLVTLGRTMIR
jgi:uncharacterized protein YjbI with pentapeptide repeats